MMLSKEETIRTMIEKKICVIIPTFNNGGTIAQVISSCLEWTGQVIVVNDGSTDSTSEILRGYTEKDEERGTKDEGRKTKDEGRGTKVRVVCCPKNGGKGYALKQGFQEARDMGYDYAITMDGDGQHFATDIPTFVQALTECPGALIVGSRNLQSKNMPGKNTFANKFSNFWFCVQTFRNLPDTQTGFRLYPLRRMGRLRWITSRYEAELEMLVYAAWHGIRLVPVRIDVYYPPQEERVSHFRPAYDFFRISVLNTILCFLAVVYGYPRMLFNLPSALRHWATYKDGTPREVPVTFRRIAYSLWALLFFLVSTFFLFMPYTLFHRLLPRSEGRQLFLHKVMCRISGFIIRNVPGMKFVYRNEVGETFQKPSVIICNHQSQLDIMAILMMSPKIVILTNDWVWNNIYFGMIIHAAEFYPVSDGLDANLPRLQNLVDRGYSVVIFPEGTRTRDRGIMRFHKGAFTLAKALNVDLLPVCLHGMVDVLPKRDFMLRQGQATLQVFPRVSAHSLQDQDDKALRSYWHKWYVQQYARMCAELETIDYCATYVHYLYMYKGCSAEQQCKKMLKRLRRNSGKVEERLKGVEKLVLLQSGGGEVALTLAYAYPALRIVACEADEQKHLLAQSHHHVPDNLTFVHASAPDKTTEEESGLMIRVDGLLGEADKN